VIAPATNAGVTLTISAGEHCDTGVNAESVTKYAYVVVTEGAVTYVDEVAPVTAREQVPSEYHLYEMEGVPPEAWDVRVIDWPASIVGADGVIAPEISAGLTATVSAGEQAEAGDWAESVTLYE